MPFRHKPGNEAALADEDWIHSPGARRVLAHRADSRPAWLWSADGQSLLWRNDAGRVFGARLKKQALKLAQPAVPIGGQVARLMRLGTVGRASLARVQFLLGEKPASATCSCTPLEVPGGQLALLIVGVDPTEGDLLDAYAPDEADERLPLARLLGAAGRTHSSETPSIPSGSSQANVDPAAVSSDDPGDASAAEPTAKFQATGHDPDDVEVGTEPVTPSQTGAGQPDPGSEAEVEIEISMAPVEPVPEEITGTTVGEEHPEPGGVAHEEGHALGADAFPARGTPVDGGRLTSLFDRLADDHELYAPLPENEPDPSGREVEESTGAVSGVGSPVRVAPGEVFSPEPQLFRLVGQGFTPLIAADEAQITVAADGETPSDLAAATLLDSPPLPSNAPDAVEAAIPGMPVDPVMATREDAELPEEEGDAMPAAPLAVGDAQTLERVSRYNFDELSRILNERIGGETVPLRSDDYPGAPRRTAAEDTGGALINLGGETLVLNRLPLGILVFRDQQVLFANRAITEMIGYPSVEALRAAGLAAIFPASGPDAPNAGPVNHLVTRDGTLVPVTARLQSISWQGKPALMLSASSTEVRTGHEAAVRAFAELSAQVRGQGFLEATRAGVISSASPAAQSRLGRRDQPIEGRPLAALLDPDSIPQLKAFLERPARFAETARPWVQLQGATPGVEVTLFAQGQAGVIAGYFGFVRSGDGTLRLAAPQPAAGDVALLGRLSRGIRRPLSAIIGFADMIAGGSSGTTESRAAEYARDIRTAGAEIEAIVDELDDFSRLADGRYLPRPTEIDLASLLESSIVRVRAQAANARVLVRSAVSEVLPPIRADRTALGQAVLNLLASAVDQTAAGGSVVLSAQTEDDGGIAVTIRDGAGGDIEGDARFVTIREDGEARGNHAVVPVRSSLGLSLTRALLGVNSFGLNVGQAGGGGTMFGLRIPADCVVRRPSAELPRQGS